MFLSTSLSHRIYLLISQSIYVSICVCSSVSVCSISFRFCTFFLSLMFVRGVAMDFPSPNKNTFSLSLQYFLLHPRYLHAILVGICANFFFSYLAFLTLPFATLFSSTLLLDDASLSVVIPLDSVVHTLIVF